MSDAKSQSMRPFTATDLPHGRRIINVPPTDSKLVAGRSARPGDPSYDQNFGVTQNTFTRATTHYDNQDLRSRPRNAHFE